MTRVRFPLVLVAVGTITVGMVVAAWSFIDDEAQPPPSRPPAPDRAARNAATIAFSSIRDGDSEIYTIGADGIGLLKLTANTADDFEPAWAPDGQRIAFVSDRDGDAEIFVMNADGTGVRQLTRNSPRGDELAPWDVSPSWSPDGRWIAFASQRKGQREIYVMRSDGGAQRRLTRRRLDWHENFTPAWSPDGRTIVFVSNREGFFNLEVFAMAPDGGSVKRLTMSPGHFGDESMPAWSPDGRRIAFVSNRDGNSEIYVMDADGRGRARLTTRPGWADLEPRWSPDGRSIAFRGTSTSSADEIFVMHADGTLVRRLTHGTSPDWRPA